MKILIIAEHDHLALKTATRSAIAAAQVLKGNIDVLVAGQGVDVVAVLTAGIDGVSRVLCADSSNYQYQLPENLAPLIQRLAGDYDAIIAASTSFGKNVLPRVAALLDVAMVSEVTRIIDASTYVRPMYAGNINATIRSADAIKVLSIRPTAFEPAPASGGSAAIVNVEAGADSGLSNWLGNEISQSERPQLGTARVVISGGRSLGSAERFEQLIAPLALKLNAAVGATRAAVDAGYAPNEWQVGQTGTVVAPELYIAVGVSGAAQHIAGIKDSKVIVAINHDPDAPIFQWADYGLVADLFDSLTELEKAL